MTATILDAPDEAPSPPPVAPSRRPVGARATPVLLVGGALAVWALVIAVGRVWGLHLQAEGRQLVLFTPPILGSDRAGLPAGFWLPVAVAVGLIAVGPRLAATLPWSRLLAAATVGAALWWAALAGVDGADGFVRGLEWEREWRPHLATASEPGALLRSFVDRLPGSSVQVRGHPPGFLLLAGQLDRLGLANAPAVAALVFAAGLAALVAILLTVRLVVGEPAARRVVPYLVLAPAATWLVTSLDTLHVAVTAWFVCALVAATRATGRRAVVLAVAAGLLAAVAALLSYGLVLMGFAAVFVTASSRRWRPLAVATATAAVGVLSLGLLGFNWFAGLAATAHEYHTLPLDRPYGFFLLANLSAFALAIGPAVAVALVLLRDRRAWVLVGGGLAAAAAANVSGLSEGEVERIWLPFTMWVYVATAALSPRWWASRALLGLQAASALALTAKVATYW